MRRSQENRVRVDNKRRVILPKNTPLADYYAIEIMSNMEIVLRPRTLVDPREVVSKKTLSVLNESMTNLARGHVGDPIDLDKYKHPNKPLSKKAK